MFSALGYGAINVNQILFKLIDFRSFTVRRSDDFHDVAQFQHGIQRYDLSVDFGARTFVTDFGVSYQFRAAV